jgi:hypothetical protein
MLTVTALRKDGFEGEISISAKDIPGGFIVSEALIPAKQNEARFTVTAPPDAAPGVVTPTFWGTATIDKEPETRPALAAEMVMQAFSYTHLLPTQEFLMSVADAPAFVLQPQVPADGALEIKQGGEVQIVVKVLRAKDVKGAIGLEAARTPTGARILTREFSVKGGFVPPEKDEISLTLSAQPNAPVGLKACVILAGSLRIGKKNLVLFSPAFPVKVVAAKA